MYYELVFIDSIKLEIVTRDVEGLYGMLRVRYYLLSSENSFI